VSWPELLLKEAVPQKCQSKARMASCSHSDLVLQTIYNAITNGTPCVIVEGSGRVADVIAQVAALPVSEITISLIQQKLSMFFQEMFETFTESRIIEWTKKVSETVMQSPGLRGFPDCTPEETSTQGT
jgi:hypothetical protein